MESEKGEEKNWAIRVVIHKVSHNTNRNLNVLSIFTVKFFIEWIVCEIAVISVDTANRCMAVYCRYTDYLSTIRWYEKYLWKLLQFLGPAKLEIFNNLSPIHFYRNIHNYSSLLYPRPLFTNYIVYIPKHIIKRPQSAMHKTWLFRKLLAMDHSQIYPPLY